MFVYYVNVLYCKNNILDIFGGLGESLVMFVDKRMVED